MQMRAWYDILGMDIEDRCDEAGVLRSSEQVRALIARERERGIPPERILLAGFSQGGAIAIHTALRYPERLAGLVALSTYMLRAGTLDGEASPANEGLTVFQCHGELDPIVPLQAGIDCRDRLRERGHPVEWSSWPMQHQVCMEEIRDLGRWMNATLAAE